MSKLWTQVKAAGNHPFPRSYHSAVESNGKIYIVGGKDPNDKPLDCALYILNTAGLKAWNLPKVTGVSPTPRHSHSATIIDNKIYIFGGHGDRFLNDWFVLNCGTLAWSQPRLNGSPPLPRSNHTATAFGKKIVVFGGACLNYTKSFNDIHIWDTEKLLWSTVQTSGNTPAPRYSHIAEVIGNKLYVIGGTDGKRIFDDIHELDLNSNIWSKVQLIGGFPASYGSSSYLFEQKIIFFGGESPNGTNNLCFAFQPATSQIFECKDTVSRTASSIAPREGHKIVCTSKNVVYILGGRGPNDSENSLMYTITPISVTFEPSSFASSEDDSEIIISEIAARTSSLEIPSVSEIQRTENLVASARDNQLSHNELLKLKASLDALKEKRDMVARKAQQEADVPESVEVTKLTAEINSLREELKTAKSTNEIVSESIQELKSKFEDLQRSLEEKNAAFDTLASQKVEVEQQFASHKAEVEQQFAIYEEEIKNMKKSSSSEQQKIASLLSELERSNTEKLQNTVSESQQVDELISQIESYQSQISTLNEIIQSKQLELETLQSEVESSHNSSEELREKIQVLESSHIQEIEKLKSEFASREEELTSEVNTLKLQVEESNETLSNYSVEFERLNSELEQLRSELHSQTEENQKLSHSLSALSDVSASGGVSDIEVARYLEKIREQEEDISRLESEVEQWMTASEELQKLGEEAVAEITLEADRLREEVSQWKRAVEEQTQRRREAEADLLNSEAKLNDLDGMLRRLLGE